MTKVGTIIQIANCNNLNLKYYLRLERWYVTQNYALKYVGGDVYVLTIQATTHKDSGLYICEIDSTPISKSFHKLTGNFDLERNFKM